MNLNKLSKDLSKRLIEMKLPEDYLDSQQATQLCEMGYTMIVVNMKDGFQVVSMVPPHKLRLI